MREAEGHIHTDSREGREGVGGGGGKRKREKEEGRERGRESEFARLSV